MTRKMSSIVRIFFTEKIIKLIFRMTSNSFLIMIINNSYKKLKPKRLYFQKIILKAHNKNIKEDNLNTIFQAKK